MWINIIIVGKDVRKLQIKIILYDTQYAADKMVFTYDAVQRKSTQLDQKGDLIIYQYDMPNESVSIFK